MACDMSTAVTTFGSERIEELWNDIQDIIGPAESWPTFQQKLFRKRHLNHAERPMLAAFVIFNGLNPVVFLDFGLLISSFRDSQAINEMKCWMQNFKMDPDKWATYYTFCTYTMKWYHLNGYEKINHLPFSISNYFPTVRK